jgi:hypothetical protein
MGIPHFCFVGNLKRSHPNPARTGVSLLGEVMFVFSVYSRTVAAVRNLPLLDCFTELFSRGDPRSRSTGGIHSNRKRFKSASCARRELYLE